MQAFRRLFAQRQFAVFLCALTLSLKLLVPTGYMTDNDHGHISVTICSGMASAPMTMDAQQMRDDMASPAARHGKSKDHGKAEMPCASSGLSAAIIASADSIQLAALIAFVLAVGLATFSPPALSRPAYLRPPLRAPPTHR